MRVEIDMTFYYQQVGVDGDQVCVLPSLSRCPVGLVWSSRVPRVPCVFWRVGGPKVDRRDLWGTG